MSKKFAVVLAVVAFVAGAALSFGVTELVPDDRQPTVAGGKLGDGG